MKMVNSYANPSEMLRLARCAPFQLQGKNTCRASRARLLSGSSPGETGHPPFVRHMLHLGPKSQGRQAAILARHDPRKFAIDDLCHHTLHIPVAVDAV